MTTTRRDFGRLFAVGGYASLFAGRARANEWIGPEPAAAPPQPDERFWASVRDHFLMPKDVAVINAANLCPAPASVVEAVVNAHDLEHDLSPANRTRMHDAREETRRLVADLLRVSADEILLTRNTSESNNMVSSGLELKAGDEVVVFADNHASNLRAWQEKGKRAGYDVKVLPQPNPHPGPEFYVDTFLKAVTPRTRLLGFSHLTNTVGDLLPARELCRAARERSVLTLVDGAQSFGLMDLDLSEMQPDFYSGSAHKWLCGPKEAGVLYVRREVQPRLQPVVISLYPGASGLSRTHEGFGQRDEPGLIGFGEAVKFGNKLGRPAIEKRSRALALRLAEGLRAIPGVKVYTHADPLRSHSVVAFDPAGRDPMKTQQALYDRWRIVSATRNGADRPGLRLAPHLYNVEADIDRAIEAVRRVTTEAI